MLDQLRNSAKSWVAKVLLGLLAASFVVWGVADVFSFRAGSALATVGNQEITAQDFTEAYRNWLQNYRRQTGQTMTPEAPPCLVPERPAPPPGADGQRPHDRPRGGKGHGDHVDGRGLRVRVAGPRGPIRGGHRRHR